MQLKIGTTLFIGGESKYHLKSGIQGLETPAIRVGQGLYAGRDGGFVSGHFYGQRNIVIPGFYLGDTCEEATQLRENLMNYLRIRYAMPIIITDFNGNSFYTEGFIADIKSNITNPRVGDFQITLTCPDPLLYTMDDSTDTSSIYTSETFTLTGTQDITINNIGAIEVYPAFTWEGDTQNFTVINNTIGKNFGLDDLVPSGKTLIDFNKRTIMIDDVCYNNDRTLNSSWFTLVPGQNDLSFSIDSASSISMTVRWIKNAKVGI